MTVGNVPPPFSIYVFRLFIYNKYDCFLATLLFDP
jgi:hypothetical protein